MPHGAFAEIAKRIYVQVAEDEERIAGRKQTVSRMSVLTGLTRKEIARLRKEPDDFEQDTTARHHRAARVITGWIRDERFHAADGEPRALAFDGEGDTFTSLAKAFSGDVPPRAVLDELLRVGAVRESADGDVELLERGYLPRKGEAEKLQILGTDVAGLVRTIRHNLDAADEERFFQRKVYYDNLQLQCLPALRDLSADRGQELLELLDRWMSEHDLDANPMAEGPGGKRAGIGIYYFEEDGASSSGDGSDQ
jgi:hypothetical protein